MAQQKTKSCITSAATARGGALLLLLMLALVGCDINAERKVDAPAVGPKAGAGHSDALTIEVGGKEWSGVSDLASKRFRIVDIQAR